VKIRLPLINAAMIVVAAAILASCATTAAPSASGAKAVLASATKLENLPGKPACFWKSNFQGDWTVLDDSTLIVRAPLAKDAYVVKLFEPVFNLSFKQGLGFEDREHVGQICNNGDDYLLVPGWQPPQVPIIAVRALTKEEEDRLLVAAGLPVPRAHATTQAMPPKN